MGNEAKARYVAIIADGNRRWAQAHGLPGYAGHKAGIDTAWSRVRDAAELGVRELVMFAFSTENWRRPRDEIDGLMTLMADQLVPRARDIGERGVRIRFIGRRGRVPATLASQIEAVEDLTAAGRAMTLFVAFDYGGRAELLDAARQLQAGGKDALQDLLYAPGMHDPEVLIRTGGDKRLSNFLLWQSANAELIFRDEFWPDFTREALEDSLAELDRRKRRYGGRSASG